jgi:hypothetical protein
MHDVVVVVSDNHGSKKSAKNPNNQPMLEAVGEDEITNHSRSKSRVVKKRHLGNGAVSTTARGAAALEVGRDVLVEDDAVASRSGGATALSVGRDVLSEDDAVSTRAGGASALSVGGELSGLDGGEGIHLKNE